MYANDRRVKLPIARLVIIVANGRRSVRIFVLHVGSVAASHVKEKPLATSSLQTAGAGHIPRTLYAVAVVRNACRTIDAIFAKLLRAPNVRHRKLRYRDKDPKRRGRYRKTLNTWRKW